MRKLRTKTRNRSSHNPKSDEPSAFQAQGVQSVVDQRGECFAQPRTSQRVDVFILTAILDVCRPACWGSNYTRSPELPS